MTKGEARQRYLRYLGEATVNGSARGDQDLADQFDYLLLGALTHVAAAFPLYGYDEAESEFIPPEDFISLEEIESGGFPVPYWEQNGKYLFEGTAQIRYRRTPSDPGSDDSAVLDVWPPAAGLIPLQCAIMAAAGSEAQSYKLASLSSLYNTMAAALQIADAPRFVRDYSIGG